MKVGFLVAFRESEVSLNFCPLWAINRSFVCIGDWVRRQKKRLFKIGNLRLFCLFGCKEQRLVAQLHPYMSPTLHLRNFVFSLEKYFRVRLLSRRNKGWNKNKTNISLSIFILLLQVSISLEISCLWCVHIHLDIAQWPHNFIRLHVCGRRLWFYETLGKRYLAGCVKVGQVAPSQLWLNHNFGNIQNTLSEDLWNTSDLRIVNYVLTTHQFLVLFSCPGQLNRWRCQSVSESVSESLLISATSEHCRAVVDNDNDNDTSRH